MQKVPPITVLILGAGSPVGVDLIQSLRDSQWPFVVWATDADPWALSICPTDNRRLLPLVSDPSYETELVSLCQDRGVEGIFMASNAERNYMARHRDRIEKETGARVFVGSHEVVQEMADKWTAHCWLEKNGFPTIPSIPATAPNRALREFAERVGFPLTVKSRRGSGSGSVPRIESYAALNDAIDGCDRPCMVQKYVDGRDVSVGITRSRDGAITSSAAAWRKSRHGVTWRARIRPFSAERRFCEKVAHALGVYGPCNLQLRWHEGIPLLFDINVRWSGSTRVRVLAGVNEVARFAVHELRGVQLPPAEPKCVDIARSWRYVVLPSDIERPDPLSR